MLWLVNGIILKRKDIWFILVNDEELVNLQTENAINAMRASLG